MHVLSPPPGQGRCLDAFTVALCQASEGGEEGWYVSTLQLQLASLEFCSACRSVPTLRVRVDENTPRTLWSACSAMTRSTSKVRICNRVPIVRAVHVTWALPMEFLLQSAANELWTLAGSLRLQGCISAACLGTVTWPRRLKRLVLDADLETFVEAVEWPASIQYLTLGGGFNQPTTGVLWPASLRQLSFREWFDQPIAGVMCPPSLDHNQFGLAFNLSIFQSAHCKRSVAASSAMPLF